MWLPLPTTHSDKYSRSSGVLLKLARVRFFPEGRLRRWEVTLIKRSFTPRQASRCKLRAYCDGFHWVNKTFTSARRTQHPFIGSLVSKFSSKIWTWLTGRSRGRLMLCDSFIIAGYLIYRHSPVLSAHVFFPTQVFLHVCLDMIRYIMTLFCSRLLASVEFAIIWKYRESLERAIYF